MTQAEELQVVISVLFITFVGMKISAQIRRGIQPVVLCGVREKLLVPLFFLWVGSIVANATGIVPAFGKPRLFESSWLVGAGMVLGLASLPLVAVALLRMGRTWRIGIDPEAREELVIDGIFAITRNPIYLFMDLFSLSVFLMTGSVYFGITFLVIAFAVHRRTLLEEQHLAEVHGAEFERYKSRVRRYFGWSSRRLRQ